MYKQNLKEKIEDLSGKKADYQFNLQKHFLTSSARANTRLFYSSHMLLFLYAGNKKITNRCTEF